MSAFTVRHYSTANQAADRKELKQKMRETIAWGVPNRESTGASAEEFVHLLRQALKEIEALEVQCCNKISS